MVLKFIADILRESQRAPAIVAGALLITITIAFIGTSFKAIEPLVFGAVLVFFDLADRLPFVELQNYITSDADGSVNLSFSGPEAEGFLTSVLLPLYGWMTAGLVAVRWALRLEAGDGGFWARFRPSVILCAVCGGLFAIAAIARDDIASLWPVFLIFVAGTLATAGWASFFGGVIDGLERFVRGSEKPSA